MAQTLSSPRGWTQPRKRRAALFAPLAVLAALLGLWAMSQPWVGISFGGVAPSCAQGLPGSATQVQTPTGTESITVSGCISGYPSVNQDDFLRDLGVNPSLVSTTPPVGAPVAEAKVGLPAATFWLLVAAVLVALGSLARNGLLFIGSAFPLLWSYNAFATHREALVWGLDPAPYAEMSGITWHSAAFVFICGLAAVGGLLVMKVNAEQRAVELEAFKRGERDKPSGLTTIQLVATALLRVQVDKVNGVLDAAAGSTRTGESPSPAKSGS